MPAVRSGVPGPHHPAARTRIEPGPLSLCIQNDIFRNVPGRAYGRDTPQGRIADAVWGTPHDHGCLSILVSALVGASAFAFSGA
jgi:hypothetical protein